MVRRLQASAFFCIFSKRLFMFIVKKIMVFVLIFAILFVIREVFDFIVQLSKENGKYTPTTARLVSLGLAISYILTIIFTGFRLL